MQEPKGNEMVVYSKEFYHCCNLLVAAGSIGGEPGDTNRWKPSTYLKLENDGGVMWSIRVRKGDETYAFDGADCLEIHLSGGSEQGLFQEALRFALKCYKGDMEKQFVDQEQEPITRAVISDPVLE